MNQEFEQLIISSILAEPKSAETAIAIVGNEMFSGLNKKIFKIIEETNLEGGYIDNYLLYSKLENRLEDELGKKEISNGLYLSELSLKVTSANHIEEYCYGLLEEYLKKITKNNCEQILFMIDKGEETQSVLNFLQSSLDKILELKSNGDTGFQHISCITEMAIKEAEDRVNRNKRGEIVGISSGINSLDLKLHFFNKGELIILAGRPGSGKTAVALNFAKNIAHEGTPVCMYSLEMSDTSLADRMLFSFCDININSYKMGTFTEWDELQRGQEELSKLPIYIDAKPQVSISYIRNHTRKMKNQNECGIIIIDYLQLIDCEDNKRNREQEIAKVTRQLKVLAKEINVPIILLAQLSRATEDTASKRPELRHLRESGAVEQDADKVIFIYRAEYYGFREIELYMGDGEKIVIPSRGIGEFIVAKNREGAIGSVPFRYNEVLSRIYNY